MPSRSQVAPEVVGVRGDVARNNTGASGWTDGFDPRTPGGSDAESVNTKATLATRASVLARRHCSPELALLLFLEVGVIAASVAVLVSLGSGPGITLRTDIGALICGAMSVLGMFCLAVLEMCTRKASACDVLAVYGQITLHINALGLGCITLLGHACWALVQLLLLAAAFAWVVFIWGAAVNLWHCLYCSKVKLRLSPLASELRRLPWRFALFAWVLLVTLACLAVVPVLREAVGLSTEMHLAEHLLLMGLGGIFGSALLSPLLLLTRTGRRRHARVRPGQSLCRGLLKAYAFSIFAHLTAALVIPLLAHLAIFLVAFFLVWLVVMLARCPRRQERVKAKPSCVGLGLCLPLLALLKTAGFLALFLFDAAFLERYLAGAGAQAFVLARQGGVCGQRGELLTDAALDAMDCAEHAKSAGIPAFALDDAGACIGYTMTVDDEVYRGYQDGFTSCLEGFHTWDELPGFDFHVLQPARGCPFSSGGGRYHRRLAGAVNGTAVSDAGSASLMPAAVEEFWSSLGMKPIGQGLRAVATKYLQLVRSVLRLEPHIPEVVPLRCAGLRRMASACAVFGALALLLLLGGCDLLGLMATSQDFLAASASGGLLGLLGLSTLAQFLQHLVLIIFQVVVAASAQMRYEVYGLFDHRCGYLVGSSDLDTASCPNAWHVPVDALAMVMLVFGFIMCFVLVWLLPFRRFVDAPAARWTVVLFRRALRRSYLTGERKAPRTPAPLWPLSALLVSLGVWPEPVAELEQISGRLEWLLPQEKEEEEAPGASWDFASWRSGALGVAQLYALCWVPLPGIGPVMCKFGLYLNRRVIFAFSRDGPSEAEPSVTFESTKAREEGSLRQLALQDTPAALQVIGWACHALLLLFLLLSQLALGDLQSRVTALATFLGFALVVAIFCAVSDLVIMVRKWQDGQQLIDSCEELLTTSRDQSLEVILGDDLTGADRINVKQAWRQLKYLPWVQKLRLPPQVCEWLSTRGAYTNVGRLLLAMKARQLDHARHPQKAQSQEVPASVMLATQVWLLRAAAHNELCLLQAQRACARKADELALEAAKGKVQSFQHWCEQKACARASAAANSLLMAYRARPKAQTSHPIWMRFSFVATTKAQVRAMAFAQKGRRILAEQESSLGISVWGYVQMEWEPSKDSMLVPADVSVGHVDFNVERPAPTGDDVMSLPSIEKVPEPVEEPGLHSLEKWEDAMGFTVAAGSLECRLAGNSARFLARDHLDVAPPLPAQEAVMVRLLPDFKPFAAKDEHLHVHWNHAVEADERLTGVVREVSEPEDEMIAKLQEAIRVSAWPSRTWMLAGAFFANVAEALGRSRNRTGGSSHTAELAARRAMLLGIATKLMATSGRRRDAHARELDMLAEDSEKPGDAEVQTPMRPMVSFKNYAVDLAHTPASPTSGATQALREALGRSPVDVEELSMALEQGRRSNVDTMLLSRGEDVFMSLIEKQAAVTRLATAIQNRMLKDLRSALQKAELTLQPEEYPDAQGVGLLQRARAVVAEEELRAMSELQEAMAGGGALRIQRALAQAREARVELHSGGAQLLAEAQSSLEAIGRRKQSIALLKVAMDSNNVGLLQAAIADCESAGVEGEVNLKAARRRVAILREAAAKLRPASPVKAAQVEESPADRAANMLQAALCHQPLDARLLRLALQEARACGLQNVDVERAQELLTSAESRVHALEEVRRAGAERNAQALAAAVRTCRQLGIKPQELLRALQQLTEEMAKVAKIAGDHGISNLMLEDVEQIRRELHDKVQAVRGGVRVVCRIRPFVEDDDVERHTVPAVEQVDPFTLKMVTTKLEPNGFQMSTAAEQTPSNKTNEAATQFRFNGRVFGPAATQEDVFEEVQGLVQSAIDGYNVLVAAGGSQSSGKSYSIFGPPFEKPAPGMPKERDWSGLACRMAKELFQLQERDDWRAVLEVDMQIVEVRGERTIDLLGRASRPELNENRSGHLAFAGAMLLGSGESTFVDGACSRRVANSRDFLRTLNSAFSASEGPYAAPRSPRTPASVLSSARGGESHVLVLMHLTRTNRASGVALHSKLVLADLAPMTSPSAAASIGTSKEVAAAYHAIEAVIKAARRDGQAAAVSTARKKHVIGQILRDCLCGQARPVFLMNINPAPAERVHTVHAVTYATALGGRK